MISKLMSASLKFGGFMIKLENLNYTYSKKSPYEKEIFKNVNIEINSQKTLILGKSGSGKSTFFKIIMKDLKVKKNTLKAPNDIAMVMQNVNSQIITSTVYDELNIGYKQKYNLDLTNEQITKLFEQFKVNFDLELDPQKLSGGQKKILIIMSMYIIDPDLIILDEPLVGLDYEHRQLIMDFIKHTTKKLFISTHQIENLVQICDQIVLINNQDIINASEQEVRELAIINPKGDACEL